MAVFKRSSFIPKSVTLDPKCINNPLVLELKAINNNMRRIDAYIILGLKGKKRLKEDEEKREKQKQRREKESNLEILRKNNPINFFRGTLPRTGFLDAIKNFILYTAMGRLAPFVIKNLPTILTATRNLIPVLTFFEKFVGNVLNGAITAIDFGYKVHDKIRKIFKDVTGDKFEKTFDDLSESLNTFLNIAVIAGLAIGGVGAGKIFKSTKVVKPQKPTNITVKQLRELAKEKGLKGYDKLKKKELIDVLKPHLPPAATVTPPPAPKAKFFGKFGKLFGRIPIIGGLIDFAVSLMFGEKIGRAAARAVGSTAGAFLGSFIPIPFAGTLLGGILGDIVGGALYDTLESYGKPKKMQSGGTVGQKATKAPRKIRAKRIQRPQKQITQRTIPGKNVGGKDELAKLFPHNDDPKVMSPMRLLTKNAAVMKNGGIFGKFLSAGVELMALGQKIERPTLLGFEKYLSYVIDSAVQNQSNINSKMLASTMFAMAEGGIVPASRTLSGSGDSVGTIVSKDIVKTLTATINNRSSEILQNIRKEMDLFVPGAKGEVQPEDGSYFDGDYKELLDLIASVESANGGYNAYNEGGADGGYKIIGYSGPSNLGPIGKNLTDMTIAEIMSHQANKNPPIHAAGRYQIIGRTLKGLIKGSYGETGIKPTDKFSPEVQDKLAIALIRHRLSTGANAQNFINEWRGLKFVKEKEIMSAIEKAKGGNIGNLRTNTSFGTSTNIGMVYKTNTDTNQYYGAPRGGRIHEGVDLDLGPNDSQITFLGGTVVNIARQSRNGQDVGYGLYVDILTPTGMIERLAELGTLDSKVKLGAVLRPGQIVSRGQSFSGVTHLEYRKPGGQTINPLEYLRKLRVIEGGNTFTFKGPKSGKLKPVEFDDSEAPKSPGPGWHPDLVKPFPPIPLSPPPPKNKPKDQVEGYFKNLMNLLERRSSSLDNLVPNQAKSPSIDYISNNRTYSDTTEQTRILIQPIIT